MDLIKNGTSSTGKTCYIKFKNNQRITKREAILAKCFDCTAGHADGRVCCDIDTCPLYPYRPYQVKAGNAGKTSPQKD